MAFGDKLKFWKKEEDFSDLGDFGLGDFGEKTPPRGAPEPGLGEEKDMFSQSAPPEMPPTPSQPEMNMAQPTFPSAAERAPPTPHPAPVPQPSPHPPPAPQQVPQPAPQHFPEPAYHAESYHRESVSKDIELISAKLDSLRATLDSINQRLAHLERIAQGERRREW